MNDPITLAATDYEEPRRLPDTTATRPPADETPEDEVPTADDAPHTGGAHGRPIRTVLVTAATGRPLEEVAELVSLLKETGQLPNPGHEALRAAAVSRPVDEVGEMVTLLGRPPHDGVETDITLRAAALGRPVEDVARLVSILGTGEPAAHPRVRPEPAGRPAPTPAPAAAPRQGWAPEPVPAARGSRALRHVLRWPVALALLVCGALHLPGDLEGVSSGEPGGLLALAVTVVCLGLGALVAVRDTAAVWRTGAVAALAVTVLHVLGGVVDFDPLAGAIGGSAAWTGVTAVLCAASAAVLAGLALQYREPRGGS
ncbi:hypothetical protein [Streptomyces sp. NPDC048340]|uniref:hypothetical protein n=1 Tax=Streptomyces sp. NPDC048340 TaxID=3365537 RepID=UPI0037198758